MTRLAQVGDFCAEGGSYQQRGADEGAQIGQPPTRKRPGENRQSLQVIKQRENGRVVDIRLCVVYGNQGGSPLPSAS